MSKPRDNIGSGMGMQRQERPSSVKTFGVSRYASSKSGFYNGHEHARPDDTTASSATGKRYIKTPPARARVATGRRHLTCAPGHEKADRPSRAVHYPQSDILRSNVFAQNLPIGATPPRAGFRTGTKNMDSHEKDVHCRRDKELGAFKASGDMFSPLVAKPKARTALAQRDSTSSIFNDDPQTVHRSPFAGRHNKTSSIFNDDPQTVHRSPFAGRHNKSSIDLSEVRQSRGAAAASAADKENVSHRQPAGGHSTLKFY